MEEDGETQNSPASGKVRILIVGDDPLARSGLSSLLTEQSWIQILGQSPSGEDLSLSAAESDADVVLWDLGQDARASLDRLRAFGNLGIPILVLAPDEPSAIEALGAGARGALFREVESDALAAALQALSQGMVVMDRSMATAALRPRVHAATPTEALTARELEVLQLLAQGLSNKLIGDRLGVTEHTAKFHVNAIMSKLGAQTRTEAVVQAVRLGLVLL